MFCEQYFFNVHMKLKTSNITTFRMTSVNPFQIFDLSAVQFPTIFISSSTKKERYKKVLLKMSVL